MGRRGLEEVPGPGSAAAERPSLTELQPNADRVTLGAPEGQRIHQERLG